MKNEAAYGSQNHSSPLEVAQFQRVGFYFYGSTKESEIFLVGDFNFWQAGTHRLVETDVLGGYSIVTEMPRGRHRYKFVVDGNWTQDSGNKCAEPDGFGGLNSVVTVSPLHACGNAAV
mgnify:CR=1 FL=1